MSFEGEKASGFQAVRQLPDPAICRARTANWPGTSFCLVHEPAECKHVRYFNETAYCVHAERAAIMARTKAAEKDLSGDSY